MPMLKRYLEEQKGQPAQDIISDIPPMHNLAAERLGYPTQKPLALLERIIQASSNEGDVVLDPFCGCGTTIDAAQKLKRKWIGIDVTHLAITLIEKRLKARYGEDCEYEVFGSPGDLAAARELALRDKYQFQWWALSRVPGAQPFGGKKKGADGGIDGVIYFKPDGRTTERAIVSVKGGGTANVSWVETLAATIDREKAPIGLLVTLVPPTREMIKRAAAVGHTKDAEGNSYARLQILTVEDLFAGRRPQIPLVTPTAGMRVAAPSVAPQIGLFE